MMKYPDLARQQEVYLASSRRAYRGKAQNFPTMNNIVVYPKDEEIANLATIDVRKLRWYFLSALNAHEEELFR